MSTRLFSLQAKLAFSSSSLRFHQQFSVPGVSATLAPLLALSSHATINQATTWSTAVEQGNSRHFSSCSGAVLPGLSRGTHGTSVSSWCRRPGHQLLHHSLLTTSSGCSEATAGSKAAASSSAGPGTPAPTHGSTPSSASASNTSINSSANSSNASSSRGDDSRLQVPPAVAAGAAAAGEAAAKAAKAAAKQASRLVRLIQATSLSEATWLQLTSIWQSHSTTITAATAAAATAGLFQLTTAAAGHVLDMSDPNVYWGCLSASAAAVAIAGLQIRSSFTVDPERVYRITMRKLNRHAGLQEVMGSPLAGSDVRLELVSQGTLFLQETLLPKRRAPRLHLMFQLTGPTKTGVVSVEAKKVFGSKYAFKTLMVELPDKPLTSQAAAAAATAATAKVAAATQTPASTTANSSTAVGGPSSSTTESSSSAGSSTGQASSSTTRPARIYIIGAPASSSGSLRHLSPSALLEDLKDPLLYGLKRNLVGYAAEDETESQLAWSKPQQDPDQTTWWDDTKKASKLLACRTYGAARSAGAAAVTAASTAAAKLRERAAAAGKLRAQAAAAASTAASTVAAGSSSKSGSSSSGNGGSLGTKPVAAVGQQAPPQAASSTSSGALIVDAGATAGDVPASSTQAASSSSGAVSVEAGTSAGDVPAASSTADSKVPPGSTSQQ